MFQLACGYHHSALLTDDGLLHTWGRSLDGQVGNGARKEVPYPTPLLTLADRPIVHMDCGADFTIAMEKNGTIFVWGSNALGQVSYHFNCFFLCYANF
jgi:alpha-tubulin suppressor-like RCC1 family protein